MNTKSPLFYILFFVGSLALLFLILGIGLCFSDINNKYKKITASLASLAVILAAVSFVIFFPYASGIAVPSAWLNIGKMLLHIYY